MNYEVTYWELREAEDRAWDALCANHNPATLKRYNIAHNHFVNFCVMALEKLMEENADTLARLK